MVGRPWLERGTNGLKALVVMMAMPLGYVKDKHLENMRSLVKPIPIAAAAQAICNLIKIDRKDIKELVMPKID
jgi:hypothetical protein